MTRARSTPGADTREASTEHASERLDYRSAARHVGVKLATLRSMVHRKQVPHIRLGKALVVFDRAALDAWLRSRSVPANA